MATIIITDGVDQFVADLSDTTYVQEAGANIESSSDAIVIDEAAVNMRVLINGTLEADDIGIQFGSDSAIDAPGATRVEIGASGYVRSVSHSVFMRGDNSTSHPGQVLVNNGTLRSELFSVFGIGHRMDIVNNGFMIGDVGIAIDGIGCRIENTGTIFSTSEGIFVTSTGPTTIINSGIIVAVNDHGISGGEGADRLTNSGAVNASVYLNGGDDIIVNSGTVNSSVSLGDGNDIYRSKGGMVTGGIDGNDGDDTFFIDSRDLFVGESIDGGNDTVFSSVTFEAHGQEIETITLTGKRNIDATGSDDANIITGNAGANTLEGEAGADTLRGGKGNDRLTGGADADIFVFRLDGSTDTVTDYVDETDRIDLSGFDGLKGFRDLKNNFMTQVGDHLHISDTNTTIILLDTLKTEMDAGDFIL